MTIASAVNSLSHGDGFFLWLIIASIFAAGLVLGAWTCDSYTKQVNDSEADDEVKNPPVSLLTVWTPTGPQMVSDCIFEEWEEPGQPPYIQITKDGIGTTFIGMPYRIDFK